jgi:hypothetical protein
VIDGKVLPLTNLPFKMYFQIQRKKPWSKKPMPLPNHQLDKRSIKYDGLTNLV